MARGTLVEGRLWIVVAWLVGLASCAWGQEWQSYQLTNLPGTSVRECSSVADTFGNLHHYLYCQMDPINLRAEPVYYMRTDFYGNVLTDTVRLNNFAGDYPAPRCVHALTDGEYSWCTFVEFAGPEQPRGLFLTQRDHNGFEVMPPTLVGYGVSSDENSSAVLDAANGTIHAVAGMIPPYYYRFTVTAETLLWRKPINGILTEGLNTSMILSPADGRPWASMVTANSQTGFFLVVRFGADTSQSTFLPLQGSGVGVGHDQFGMDTNRNSDFGIGVDTAHMAYVRLDSTFQNILDYRTVSRFDGSGSLKTDAAGNCFYVSSVGRSLYWMFRRYDGEWIHPLAAIDSNMEAFEYSIVEMDTGRFAFTAVSLPRFQDFSQVRLYIYGFPPNGVTAPKPATTAESLSAYPNPFGSTLQLSLPGLQNQSVVLFDILGRTVWSQTVPAGIHDVKVSDPRLAQLPYGIYFLALQGHSSVVPIQITHIK